MHTFNNITYSELDTEFVAALHEALVEEHGPAINIAASGESIYVKTGTGEEFGILFNGGPRCCGVGKFTGQEIHPVEEEDIPAEIFEFIAAVENGQA